MRTGIPGDHGAIAPASERPREREHRWGRSHRSAVRSRLLGALGSMDLGWGCSW